MVLDSKILFMALFKGGLFGIRMEKEDGYHFGWVKTKHTLNSKYINNYIDSIVYCRLPNRPFTIGHFDVDL